MNMSLLGVMAWWKLMLGVVFMLACAILIILVLLQKGRGGGLSAAFGGAGGQSAFGSKTGDVFTWVTIVVAAVFLLLAMVMSPNFTPDDPDQDVMQSPSGPAGQQLPGGSTSGARPAPVTDEPLAPPIAPVAEPPETEDADTTEPMPPADEQPAPSGAEEGE